MKFKILSHHHHHHIPSSSTFSSFSPSDSDSLSPFNSHVRRSGDFVAWMSVGLHILSSKLSAIIVSSFRNSASERGAVSSIGGLWCWFRKWRRRWSLTHNEIRLINIIKDKDEMIAKLLHQIAQMNEVLIARHKALAAKMVE